MSIKVSTKINRGSDFGVNVTIYDSNSSAIVPSSLDWGWFDSFGTAISSGGLTSGLSSGSLITISSSLTLTVSGETRAELKRELRTKATYNDSELGNGAEERESFVFTLVNNPGL